MPAGNVPQFVRQHPLHLVGGVGLVDQPGVHIDALTPGHESVDRIVVDQHHVDRALAQPGGLGQRVDHILQQRLGLGIAQYALRDGGVCAQNQQGAGGNDVSEDTHAARVLAPAAMNAN